MEKIKINSETTLSEAIGRIRAVFKEKRYFTITITIGKARTLPLNATTHVWYNQVAIEEGEYTPEEVKCLCKFHFGLPIIRATDEELNIFCCEVIDQMTYENKIKAMKFLPVTSRMTTKQIISYMEHVQAHYFGRVELKFEKEKKK